jgi:hypothetical protein
VGPAGEGDERVKEAALTILERLTGVAANANALAESS